METSTVWLWQLKNEGKPKEISRKGRTSYSQTITVSESRWAFPAGYSESFFLKMLTEGYLGQLREKFSVACVVVLYGDYSPITQTLFLLLLGHMFHSPSSPAVTVAESYLAVQEEGCVPFPSQSHPASSASQRLRKDRDTRRRSPWPSVATWRSYWPGGHICFPLVCVGGEIKHL